MIWYTLLIIFFVPIISLFFTTSSVIEQARWLKVPYCWVFADYFSWQLLNFQNVILLYCLAHKWLKFWCPYRELHLSSILKHTVFSQFMSVLIWMPLSLILRSLSTDFCLFVCFPSPGIRYSILFSSIFLNQLFSKSILTI